MNSLLGLPKDEFLVLDFFSSLETDSFWVYFFNLLLKEEQLNLEHILNLFLRDIAFNSEMANIIEFNLFLIVSKQKCL